MPETQEIPEIYADFVQIATGNNGTFLGFRAINPTRLLSQETSGPEIQQDPWGDLKAVVRLTQADAKVFAIVLRRALKGHEQASGEIPLPPEFAEAVKLAADEW